ncbi:MAG: hypothetical protein QXH39_03585 [Conexivisphaerales archaeon]
MAYTKTSEYSVNTLIEAIDYGRPEQILPWDSFPFEQVRGLTEFEKFLINEHSF